MSTLKTDTHTHKHSHIGVEVLWLGLISMCQEPFAISGIFTYHLIFLIHCYIGLPQYRLSVNLDSSLPFSSVSPTILLPYSGKPVEVY